MKIPQSIRDFQGVDLGSLSRRSLRTNREPSCGFELQVANPTADVIVVSQAHDREFVRVGDKAKAPRQPGATFEGVVFQLPNAEPAVDVRVAECLAQLEKSHDRPDLVSVGQRAKLFLNGGA